jgi:4'-phosphopantetheinyl transferase
VKPSADSGFVLSQNQVHVWYRELLEHDDIEEFESVLSPDEKQRAARFRFPVDRQRFMAARGTLRQLLAEYLGTEAFRIAFSYAKNGKPELSAGFQSGRGIEFNVAHSNQVCAFAFANRRAVGIDIEFIRENVDVEGIARRFFSTFEQQSLAQLSGPEKYTGFFNCWTRKEAYVKALGAGLFSLPLRDFDVTLAPGEPARLVATRFQSPVPSHWSMSALVVKEGYAAAVAAEGSAVELTVRQFPSALR